jgi:hypothetical protein
MLPLLTMVAKPAWAVEFPVTVVWTNLKTPALVVLLEAEVLPDTVLLRILIVALPSFTMPPRRDGLELPETPSAATLIVARSVPGEEPAAALVTVQFAARAGGPAMRASARVRTK